jgi:antitoxin ParD1/3/4
MSDLVRAKVATGEDATESEVIRDGLRVLLARDRAVEDWLREEVAPAYDALKADPSRALSAEHVRATVSTEHRKALAKKRYCPSSSVLSPEAEAQLVEPCGYIAEKASPEIAARCADGILTCCESLSTLPASRCQAR